MTLYSGPSGRVVGQLPVGGDPVAAAADAQTGRVVVLTVGRTDPAPVWISWLDQARRWLPWLPQPVAVPPTLSRVVVFDRGMLP